jgi:phosphinothricin acetyltransferase
MIQVRHAVENDVPAILVIYNDIIQHTTAVYDYKPHTLEMMQSWFRGKQEKKMPVFAAEENGQLLGFSSIGPFRGPWAAYKYSVENSVHVAADCRGKGIGK